MVPKEQIHSLCAYGSKVAGLEKQDSDYDIIIVTKDFEGSIPDKPDQAAKKSLPIIVDAAALLNAAQRPALGESIIGRFLNVYEPLINEEYLRKVEVEYKKRVIAEELMEIQSDYGDFSSNLIIPYEYFLFDRLHKRALEYPGAIESFANIYGGDLKVENLELTLRGFRDGAELLASQGIIEKTEDSVRIFRDRRKRKSALAMLYKMYPLTTRGAIKYAFHTLASGLGVESRTRPLLKLRFIDKIKPIVELDRPNKLLKLEEGVIFDDASKAVEEIALLSGFNSSYESKEKKKGDVTNASKELEIWDDSKRAKFILKQFPQLKSVKWVLLNLWSVAAKRFNMSPLSRLNREVEAVRRLHGLGIKTHRITGIILGERTLVTEYFEGEPLDKSVQEITDGKSTDTSDIKKYAQILGRLHKAGLVYGDTKPQNALVGKDGIYLLDLEQAVERGDRAWDLAEFLYYSAKVAKKGEGMKLVAESFLLAYRSENGYQVIAKAGNKRYLTPFLIFLKPEMRKVVRDAIADYSVPE